MLLLFFAIICLSLIVCSHGSAKVSSIDSYEKEDQKLQVLTCKNDYKALFSSRYQWRLARAFTSEDGPSEDHFIRKVSEELNDNRRFKLLPEVLIKCWPELSFRRRDTLIKNVPLLNNSELYLEYANSSNDGFEVWFRAVTGLIEPLDQLKVLAVRFLNPNARIESFTHVKNYFDSIARGLEKASNEAHLGLPNPSQLRASIVKVSEMVDFIEMDIVTDSFMNAYLLLLMDSSRRRSINRAPLPSVIYWRSDVIDLDFKEFHEFVLKNAEVDVDRGVTVFLPIKVNGIWAIYSIRLDGSRYPTSVERLSLLKENGKISFTKADRMVEKFLGAFNPSLKVKQEEPVFQTQVPAKVGPLILLAAKMKARGLNVSGISANDKEFRLLLKELIVVELFSGRSIDPKRLMPDVTVIDVHEDTYQP